MKDEVFDFVIVGAGMTGLDLGARLTTAFPKLNLKILEKSKSCGGRVATRRIDDIKFDHGVQFIEETKYSKPLIQFWRNLGLVQKFPHKSVNGICANSGMTQLPKSIARGQNIEYEFKVASLNIDQNNWQLTSDQGKVLSSRNVLFTAPLPQSLDILTKSNIDYDSNLNEISYSKAIVLLIESHEDFDPTLVYQEGSGETFLSITAQHKKGNSSLPAWTVVMRPSWSHDYFDLNETQILETAIELIEVYIPNLRIKNCTLKKWRYAFSMKQWHKTFEIVKPGVYLAGDAFGGPSVNGALLSSNDLFNHLKPSIDSQVSKTHQVQA